MKFNLLTHVRYLEMRKQGKKTYRFDIWLCECGIEKIISWKSVKSGQTKSCGCLHKKNIHKLPRGEGSLNTLVYTYKNNARKRNISYDLTIQEFKELTSGICNYCGVAPTKEFKRPPSCSRPHNGNYIFNGIDRVDNSVGYVYSNCVSCCETCNKAKLAMNKEDFLAWVERVYRFSFMEKQ